MKILKKEIILNVAVNSILFCVPSCWSVCHIILVVVFVGQVRESNGVSEREFCRFGG